MREDGWDGWVWVLRIFRANSSVEAEICGIQEVSWSFCGKARCYACWA